MTIPVGLVTGPQNLGNKGSQGPLRGGNTAEAIVSKYLPDYSQIAFDGNSYGAANQAAQAITVGLAAVYTGIGLYNPAGSGVILVPISVKYALSVAPAAIATLGLMAALVAKPSDITLTTKLNVQSTQIGSGRTGQGVPFSSVTFATVPTWIDELIDGFTAAALPAPQNGPIDLRGKWALYPGSAMAIGALTAVTGLGAIVWAEVPLAS